MIRRLRLTMISVSGMTSFKRKRIEKWVEDVALYLRNGTICRSVIGHVAEDAICGNSLASASAHSLRPVDGENAANDSAVNGSNPAHLNVINSSSSFNSKMDQTLRKATKALGMNDGLMQRDNPPLGSMSGPGHGVNTFPVVKFAYSHYHEQRRKIDRLVQGLPVLNGNNISSVERPSSKASTEDQAAVIFVSGEEPFRTSQTRSRSSSQARNSHSKCFANGKAPTGHHHHYNNNSITNLQSPHTGRLMGTPPSGTYGSPHTRSSSCDSKLWRSGGVARLYDVKEPRQSEVTVTVDPGLAPSANERLSRIKTAPAPNRNVYRARQRILTRRGNRVLDHTSQIPLQNCWAMAELTW